MGDSNSKVSLQSGDPDKYWWLVWDDPYKFPPEWDHPEDQPGNVHGDEASTIDDDSSKDNPHVLELENLTRDMEGRIQELEENAQLCEVELNRDSTFNDQLVERDATLCTYICTKWVEDEASEARVKHLTLPLRIAIALLIGLLGLVIALLNK